MDGVEVLQYGRDRADRLAMLRSQRNLLFTLCAEITAMRRHLIALDPSEFWSSKSQRAYSRCVAEMVQDLGVVLHDLQEALASVRGQIQLEEHLCQA
ncbi:MAG: hypothetical protein LH475_06210 [Cryobacterium sp.]|uniref:hypothetical protein n=1 Tax=unclassified Cryobacterium TaxID=2649013 RepID=UPI0018C9A2B7|nr:MULTISPECIES: hypothetical protein [unclassified Cryobacterium]MCY7404202.1 hypothetical protein [Cryobacterium sp.]MEC5153753.1 hypothetical protein [Cryobacterium sp. CAN_C3]